jgi:hypothetical protein
MLVGTEIQAQPTRSPGEWVEAPLLAAATLAGSFWSFGELDGQSRAPFLVLAPEGLIGNVFHEQLDYWHVVNGRLCFIDVQGLPAIVFNVAQMKDGKVVALAGRAVLAGVDAIYVLEMTGHPPHAVSPTPSHVERRASFLKQPQTDARRPNLIVVRAGPPSLHPRWLEGTDARTRSWDLCVSWYGDEVPDGSLSPEYLVHAPNQKKFKPIFDLFYEGSPLWDYDRIWLPDDDLLVSGSDINRMFHLSRKYGLDLSQPSLRNSPDCHINHPITAQRPGSDVRLEPFVEIMAPLFSARALKICVGSIRDAVSGYGLDHLWPSFLGKPKTRMGIIDAVSIVHTRPIGATYDVRGAIAEQAGLWKAYGFTYAPIEGVR